jgi:uncharacterized membrane protein YuzA (DUF378 family)
MQRNNTLVQIFLWLAIIGAINWGLVGFFNFNLVGAIFGGGPHVHSSALSRVIYAIVGLAGLGLAFFAPRLRDVGGERRIRGPAEVRP